MKKKKIILDMLLNIIAVCIPTVVLQLMILPSLAKYMDGDEYGLLVTILAVLNVLPSTIGNMMNNVRILYEEKYKAIGKNGDFQILLIITQIINILIMCSLSVYYLGTRKLILNILLVILSVFWLGREYYIVTFRIKLNYIDIVLNNIILVIGYFIGYILFLVNGYWQQIYILGFAFSYIHIVIRSRIIQEPIIKTPFFKSVTKDLILITIATILARAINYADKILLYPILGGATVSVYYVATIFSKVVSLAITPINSVALSYLSKVRKKSDSLFKWTLIMGIILCVIGYVSSLLLSRPVLGFLYPTYVDQAMQYIYITSATVVISVLTSMLNPFILRFFEMKWQICINAITVCFYIISSLMLVKPFGLYGFCYGSLLTNVIKLFVTISVFYKCKEKDSGI